MQGVRFLERCCWRYSSSGTLCWSF